FAQLDPHGEGGGLGIGLALVRRLVELHGGTVHAHSAGPGRGSEFFVCLPVLAGDRRSLQGAAEAGGDMRGRRILVVDDNEDAAESLSLLLEMLGATSRTVNRGSAVLKAIENLQPEVVLLDIAMPEMDGYQVAEAIRAHPLGQSIRLIALTGFGQQEDRQRTLRSGFNDHLVKPVILAELEKAIAGALDL